MVNVVKTLKKHRWFWIQTTKRLIPSGNLGSPATKQAKMANLCGAAGTCTSTTSNVKGLETNMALQRWHISGWCVVAKPVEKEETWTVAAEPKTTAKGKTAEWKQTVKQMKENRKTAIKRKPGPMKMGWPGHVSNWSSGETALAKKNSAKDKTRAKHQQRVPQDEARPRSRKSPHGRVVRRAAEESYGEGQDTAAKCWPNFRYPKLGDG